jgi:hypothetical protein
MPTSLSFLPASAGGENAGNSITSMGRMTGHPRLHVSTNSGIHRTARQHPVSDKVEGTPKRVLGSAQHAEPGTHSPVEHPSRIHSLTLQGADCHDCISEASLSQAKTTNARRNASDGTDA